ncbi:hypothetical protein LBP97_06460 [Serratia marcescens]|nr:hypothetical protein LBP97_06460 [Serratia marcescens]
MSTEKLSELSKPVAQIYYDEHDSSVMRIGWLRSDEPKNPEPLYSQEYVSALKHESAVNWEEAASLNVENQELKKRIAELEAKLATPVRLPRPGFVTCSGERHYTYGADEVKGAVRTAGFTVEGDDA